MPANIPLSFTPIDSEAIEKQLKKYTGLSHENIIEDFEQQLGAFTKAKHVVALNSGTAAIHLALKAVGVTSGDEVLVSTFTYVATVNPILYLGASPVFIEVEEQSWNMDPIVLEMAINDRLAKGKKPRAILVVHAYGMPARMEEIMKVSQRYQIPVIEDAAEALGSRIGMQSVGTLGEIGILSFNNNKILTTYGGGAVLTGDAEMARRIAFWAGQSRESKVYYEHKELGYNYRMGPVNAAIGLSKMDNLRLEIEERRSSFDAYRQLLETLGCQFQIEGEGVYSNRWLSAFSFKEQELKLISENIDNQLIETRRVWNPMHLQPVFKAFKYFKKKAVSESLFSKTLCLPSRISSANIVAERLIEILVTRGEMDV